LRHSCTSKNQESYPNKKEKKLNKLRKSRCFCNLHLPKRQKKLIEKIERNNAITSTMAKTNHKSQKENKQKKMVEKTLKDKP
jgi:hypothetical protein